MYDEYVESALPAGNMNVEWTSNANPTGVGGAGGGGGACFHPFVRTFFHTPHPIHIRPFLWLRLVEAFSPLVSLLFHVKKLPMTVWSMMISVEAKHTGITNDLFICTNVPFNSAYPNSVGRIWRFFPTPPSLPSINLSINKCDISRYGVLPHSYRGPRSRSALIKLNISKPRYQGILIFRLRYFLIF